MIRKTASDLQKAVGMRKIEKEWSYEKDPPYDGGGAHPGAAAVAGWVRLFRRQDPPDLPDLGHQPAQGYGGHVRRNFEPSA